MLFRRHGKNYEENRLAEMVALIGGSIQYLEQNKDLSKYEEYYLENKKRDGFHYKMQRIGDKFIRTNLKSERIYCKRSRTKRFYRYNTNQNSSRVEEQLYHYFRFVMDQIMKDEILKKITWNHILEECKCSLDSEYDICLNKILDWQYKRLIKIKTNFTIQDMKKKEKAQNVLYKLNSYPRFGRFKNECQKSHGIIKD